MLHVVDRAGNGPLTKKVMTFLTTAGQEIAQAIQVRVDGLPHNSLWAHRSMRSGRRRHKTSKKALKTDLETGDLDVPPTRMPPRSSALDAKKSANTSAGNPAAPLKPPPPQGQPKSKTKTKTTLVETRRMVIHDQTHQLKSGFRDARIASNRLPSNYMPTCTEIDMAEQDIESKSNRPEAQRIKELKDRDLQYKRDWLITVPIFNELAAAETVMSRLATMLESRSVEAGSVIITKGDTSSTEMYFIREGQAEVLLEQDSEAVALLGPGKFFGEEALVTASPRNAHIVAVSDILLYVLEKSNLQSVFCEFPGMEDIIKDPMDQRTRKRVQELEAAAAAEAAVEEEMIAAQNAAEEERLRREREREAEIARRERERLDEEERFAVAQERDLRKRQMIEDLERKRDWLITVPIFNELAAAETVMSRLATMLESRSVEAGSVIITKGDTSSTEMYFIREGQAEVLLEQDSEAVALLGPGKFFGEEALVTASPRNAHIVAVSDLLLYVLEKSNLQSVFCEFPGMEDIIKDPMDQRTRRRVQELEAAAAAEAAVEEEMIAAQNAAEEERLRREREREAEIARRERERLDEEERRCASTVLSLLAWIIFMEMSIHFFTYDCLIEGENWIKSMLKLRCMRDKDSTRCSWRLRRSGDKN
eukprot:SAG31_NODE_1219_length_9302_cov_13.527328_7_plen_650_part_00